MNNVTDEIEESLRICEELLNKNPDFIAEELVPRKIETDEVTFEEPEKELEKETEKKTAEKLEENQEEKPEEKSEEEERTESWKVFFVRLGSCVAIAFVVAFLITRFIANHTTVEGNSMEPCLQNGDELIVEKVEYMFGEPERFDVIVFEQSRNVNYVKRVIGLPGETIQIKDEKIFINGRALFDKYRMDRMKSAGIAENEITLGADEYFVLGDNRNASKDSRDETVGPVKKSQIRGKVWLRILPSENFGKIE